MAYTKIAPKALRKVVAKPKEEPEIKTITQLLAILEKDKKFDDYDMEVCYDEFPGQCGMQILHDLYEISPKNQAIDLLRIFFPDYKDNRTRVGMIVISDIVDKSGKLKTYDRWYATKSVALSRGYAGPIVVNPNTKNHVRHFSITPDMIMEIYNFTK